MSARPCFFCRTPTTRKRRVRVLGKKHPVCDECVPTKANKYRAKHTVVDGIRFDSRREADTWTRLRLAERAGDISDLQRQVSFDLHGRNGATVCIYRVDFTYAEAGRLVACEVKGYRTKDYLIKRKLFLDEYGGEYEHREV